MVASKSVRSGCSAEPMTQARSAVEGAAAVAAAVADAHRREWAFVLAATVRLTRDLDLAEECAQDAFAQALTSWAVDGVPARPGAWLTRSRGGARSTRYGTRTSYGGHCRSWSRMTSSPRSTTSSQKGRARSRTTGCAWC